MAAVEPVDVNGWACVIAVALLASIAPASLALAPVIGGGYVEYLAIEPAQVGDLIGLELMGAALASVPVFLTIGRVNWRILIRAGLALCMFANLYSGFTHDLGTLFWIRFAAGLGFGTVMTLTIVIVGATRDQERNFGYWSIGQVLFSVIGFLLFPAFMGAFGIVGFFWFMVAIMAGLQTVVYLLPQQGSQQHADGLSALPRSAKTMVPIGLLALLLFYIGIGSLWPFVELIGKQEGFGGQMIANTLSVASIVGLGGALLASWMSTRFGRLLPSLSGYVLIGVTMAMFYGTPSLIVFVAACLAYKFAWWFLTPYVLGNMTKLDPSGRLAILTNFVIAAGMGGGPILAARFIGETGTRVDYSGVVVLAVGSIVLSFALLLFVIRYNTRHGVDAPVITTEPIIPAAKV